MPGALCAAATTCKVIPLESTGALGATIACRAGRLVQGCGRIKWQKENRPLSRDTPSYAASKYRAKERHDSPIRAYRDDVPAHMKKQGQVVDVRSPEEYSGERMHMPDYPNEGALRGGHLPGAKSVPWARAITPEDGTFKSAADFRQLYCDTQKLSPREETIAYSASGNAAATRGSR